MNPNKKGNNRVWNRNNKHTGLLNVKRGNERTYTTYLGLCSDNRVTFDNQYFKDVGEIVLCSFDFSIYCVVFSMKNKRKSDMASILVTLVYAAPLGTTFCDKNRIRSFLKFCARMFRLTYDKLLCILNEAAKTNMYLPKIFKPLKAFSIP